MKIITKYVVFSLILMRIEAQEENAETVENCRERNRLISTEKGDLYALVDATVGDKLILQCHYCRESDDNRPKLWYIRDLYGISQPEEVIVSMKNNDSSNRIQITPEHNLNILNTTKNDTGIYFCVGLEQQDNPEQINYLVDLVEKPNISNMETGNITDWLKYHEDNMFPINYLFKNSLSPEYVYLRDQLKLLLELKTDWDQWGPCEVCGRPNNQGIKKRRGRCRMKIERSQINDKLLNRDEVFLVNAFEISCRSILFRRMVPTIFNATRIIPDYVETSPCEGICNPDAEGANAGWKVSKSKSYKYRKTVVLLEGDHLTLNCPESTLENKVTWKRNGMELKRGESVKPDKSDEEPRILVDTFSTLYLVEVKRTEEGNYTCVVDDIKMQQVIVYITTKSKLFTKLFLRHLMYLGFILSLTLSCYCGGLVIACRKRHTFKTYKMLKEEAKEPLTEDSEDEG